MKTEQKTFPMYDNQLLFWEDGLKEYALKIVQETDICENPRVDMENIGIMFCKHPRYTLGDQDTGYANIGEFLAALIRDNVPSNVVLSRIKDGTVRDAMSRLKAYTEHDETDSVLSDEDLLENFYDMITEETLVATAGDTMTDYVAWLPLWLYDHSGITMSCGARRYPYNDRFDSSAVGIIAMTKQKAMESLVYQDENGTVQPVTEENWEKVALQHLEDEVRTYDQYLTGEVYGYQLFSRPIGRKSGTTSSEEEWEEEDSCYGFYGSDIMENGIYDNVGFGLEKAILSGNYKTGEAKSRTVVYWDFIKQE